MDYRTWKRMIGGILLGAALILTIIGIVVFVKIRKDDAAFISRSIMRENIEEPYKKEIDELKSELVSVDNAINGSNYNMGSFLFMFMEPSKSLTFGSEANSLFQKWNYKGIIAVSNDFFENPDTYMSIDDLKALISDGWSVCYSISDANELPSLALDFKDAGLETNAVCYPDGNYKISDDNMLKKYDIDTVVSAYSTTHLNEDSMFVVRSYGSYEMNCKTEMKNSILLSRSICFMVSFVTSSQMYFYTNVNAMMEFAFSYESIGTSKGCDLVEARERYLTYTKMVADSYDANVLRKEEIEARLDELETILAEIRRQLNE